MWNFRQTTVLLPLLGLALGCANQEPGPGLTQQGSTAPGLGRHRGMGAGMPQMACDPGSGALTPETVGLIERALADERRAEATNQAIGGAVLPFAQIERAERRHAAALESLLISHQVTVPEPAALAPMGAAPSLREACALGVEAETANIALYDELLTAELPADVSCVFKHLQAASRERHIPAFTRCAGAANP